jgi:hypothetical protein
MRFALPLKKSTEVFSRLSPWLIELFRSKWLLGRPFERAHCPMSCSTVSSAPYVTTTLSWRQIPITAIGSGGGTMSAMLSNSALMPDVYTSPLRARYGAAKRER